MLKDQKEFKDFFVNKFFEFVKNIHMTSASSTSQGPGKKVDIPDRQSDLEKN